MKRSVAGLTLFAVLCLAAAGTAADSSTLPRCTMEFGERVEFSKTQLMLLAKSTSVSALAPGGIAAAPERAQRSSLGPPMASRFRIVDVPAFIAKQHAAVLARARGTIWVVPWFRNTACMLESSWLQMGTDRDRHAVLFLTPRAENLWVNGEPTFDAFDDFIPPHSLWEDDSIGGSVAALRDLRVFLAVYPRLAAVVRWNEGSAYNWALRHRDSANTAALRGRFQAEASRRLHNSLTVSGSPLAGVWQGDGTMANGDSLHFWMKLAKAPLRLEWPGDFGTMSTAYTGPARFDSLPSPTQFVMSAAFATTRDSLPPDGTDLREQFTAPFASKSIASNSATWTWLARFAPPSRRAELLHNDSLTTGMLRPATPSVPPHATQRITRDAAGDSLRGEIRTSAGVIANWTAHRVP